MVALTGSSKGDSLTCTITAGSSIDKISLSDRRAKRDSQALSLGYLGNVVDLWYVYFAESAIFVGGEL